MRKVDGFSRIEVAHTARYKRLTILNIKIRNNFLDASSHLPKGVIPSVGPSPVVFEYAKTCVSTWTIDGGRGGRMEVGFARGRGWQCGGGGEGDAGGEGRS